GVEVRDDPGAGLPVQRRAVAEPRDGEQRPAAEPDDLPRRLQPRDAVDHARHRADWHAARAYLHRRRLLDLPPPRRDRRAQLLTAPKAQAPSPDPQTNPSRGIP